MPRSKVRPTLAEVKALLATPSGSEVIFAITVRDLPAIRSTVAQAIPRSVWSVAEGCLPPKSGRGGQDGWVMVTRQQFGSCELLGSGCYLRRSPGFIGPKCSASIPSYNQDPPRLLLSHRPAARSSASLKTSASRSHCGRPLVRVKGRPIATCCRQQMQRTIL